jgi:DnaJ-class molecular chaperone
MTFNKAQYILKLRPLLFGDAEQIQAVRYLQAFSASKEDGTSACPQCDGAGMVECECSDCGDIHERDCPECDGQGVIVPDELEVKSDPRQLWLFPEWIPIPIGQRIQ